MKIEENSLEKNELIVKIESSDLFQSESVSSGKKANIQKKLTRNCIFLWTIPIWIELVHISPFNILTLWLKSGNAHRIAWWGVIPRCVPYSNMVVKTSEVAVFLSPFLWHIVKRNVVFVKIIVWKPSPISNSMRRKFTLAWQRPRTVLILVWKTQFFYVPT